MKDNSSVGCQESETKVWSHPSGEDRWKNSSLARSWWISVIWTPSLPTTSRNARGELCSVERQRQSRRRIQSSVYRARCFSVSVGSGKVLGHDLKASWYGWRNKWRSFRVTLRTRWPKHPDCCECQKKKVLTFRSEFLHDKTPSYFLKESQIVTHWRPYGKKSWRSDVWKVWSCIFRMRAKRSKPELVQLGTDWQWPGDIWHQDDGLPVVQRGVTPVMRKRFLNDMQQGLTSDPLPFKGVNVRADLELDRVKRPWNKAQAIFTGVIKEHANVSREAFDICEDNTSKNSFSRCATCKNYGCSLSWRWQDKNKTWFTYAWWNRTTRRPTPMTTWKPRPTQSTWNATPDKCMCT